MLNNVWNVYIVILFNIGRLIHLGPRLQSQTLPLLVHLTSLAYLLGFPGPSAHSLEECLLGQTAEVG